MLTAPPTEPRNRRLQGLLNKAVRDPRRVLRDRRIRKPRFCLPFFELCDALAYEEPERAAELSRSAADFGRRSGDRHLANRGLGVEVNARIALAQWDRAKAALERHEAAAADCCGSCLADHLHRRADLALEYRRTPDAMLYLAEVRPALEAGWGGAENGRLLNLRAIGRHFLGENGAAVDDSGTALLIMPLDAPRLFFRDAIGLIACFLAGGDRRLDELALEYLLAFKKRLRGATGWQLIRTRLAWVEGIVHARLGDEVSAAARLESARHGLAKELGLSPAGGATPGILEDGLVPGRGTLEMIALVADLSQLATQRRESRATVSMLYAAQTTLILEPRLGQTLGETLGQVRVSPESALEYLEDLRTAVRVPVPGLLAERYLNRSRTRFKKRRRPSASPYSFAAVAAG